MNDPMSLPAKRPRLTLYYHPTVECSALLDAAQGVLFPKREHPEFPVSDELRSAAAVSIAAVCRAVQSHTARWGTPGNSTPSTWEAVAWEHHRRASLVLGIVSTPSPDLAALKAALDEWRAYGR
jgi:hypothetical protein